MTTRRPLRLAPLGIALVFVAAPAGAQEYVEGVNDHLPVQEGWTATGNIEQAFRWTPQNSFDLVQILWHTTAIPSGLIRLREDTGSVPGQVLREVAFSSNTEGWNGAAFSQPYPVVAGQSYFVCFYSSADYQRYVAQDGQGARILTYYWTNNNGQTWNGPFSGTPGRRMIKFYRPSATCDPCDTNCDGLVNASDIEDFIGLLFEGEAPCGGGCAGDTNGDGTINAQDIEGFINCLFG